jgi:hypothetical protein
MKTWNVPYCKIPTNYNPQKNARVKASTAEDARKLVIRALGQDAPGMHDYVIGRVPGDKLQDGMRDLVPNISEYAPEEIEGKVESL